MWLPVDRIKVDVVSDSFIQYNMGNMTTPLTPSLSSLIECISVYLFRVYFKFISDQVSLVYGDYPHL